ncbi:MAG: hypothetical protein ABIO43_13440 [Sphingomicrobium sp.]
MDERNTGPAPDRRDRDQALARKTELPPLPSDEEVLRIAQKLGAPIGRLETSDA